MSIDSLASYNSNNVNDTLYIKQKQNSAVVNAIPQKATRTSYAPNISLETPPDTFELSTDKRIKKNKEKDMPTWLKGMLWIGGTSAAIYGCVVGHRAMTKPSLEILQKNFTSIFRREVSKDEAKLLANKYREILKENDVDSLCRKLFEQVKKDYGYENTNIKLDIDRITEEARKNEAGGGWLIGKARVALRPYCREGHKMTYEGKKQILTTLMHEFQHVKQSEIAYRTDAEKYIQILKKNKALPTGDKLKKELNEMQRILSDEGRLKTWARERNQSVEELKRDINKALNDKDYSAFTNFDEAECRQNLKDLFGKYSKLSPRSDEYEKGLQYLDNEANYINGHEDKAGYFEQIMEKEAYAAEEKLKDFYDYIKSIW